MWEQLQWNRKDPELRDIFYIFVFLLKSMLYEDFHLWRESQNSSLQELMEWVLNRDLLWCLKFLLQPLKGYICCDYLFFIIFTLIKKGIEAEKSWSIILYDIATLEKYDIFRSTDVQGSWKNEKNGRNIWYIQQIMSIEVWILVILTHALKLFVGLLNRLNSKIISNTFDRFFLWAKIYY